MAIRRTNHLGMALVSVLHFLDDKWKLQQHLIQAQMLANNMKSDEIARELIYTLSVSYGISSSRPLAAMRDRCLVNSVALIKDPQSCLPKSGGCRLICAHIY